MSTIVGRLVGEGDFDAAWRIHRLARKIAPAERFVRNGQFDRSDSFSPFDWRLESGVDLVAEPLLIEGSASGPALVVRATAGSGGRVGQQLLFLQPGTYQFRSDLGPVPDSTPASLTWDVVCAGEDATVLAESEPRLADLKGNIQFRFSVPAGGCPAQWLNLKVGFSDDSSSVAAWVDSVVIRPLRDGIGAAASR